MRSQIPYESADSTIERIILVAGHHVRGARNLKALCLWDQLPQLRNALVMDDLTAGTADDQDRYRYVFELDQMAAKREQLPKYFDPDVPETFRFLAEAALRRPSRSIEVGL